MGKIVFNHSGKSNSRHRRVRISQLLKGVKWKSSKSEFRQNWLSNMAIKGVNSFEHSKKCVIVTDPMLKYLMLVPRRSLKDSKT